MSSKHPNRKRQIIGIAVAVVSFSVAGLQTARYLHDRPSPGPKDAPWRSGTRETADSSPERTRGERLARSDQLIAAAVGASPADRPVEPPPAPRNPAVALMDFVSDDGLYHSLEACRRLTATVQALVTDVPRIRWVERERLELAERELRLLAFGGSGTAQHLRIGAWVQADLMVRGRVRAVSDEERSLRLEVVDLYHGNVLTSRTLRIADQTIGAFRFADADAGRVAAALRKALGEARRRVRKEWDRPTIAALFLRNAGATARLDFLESDLLGGIERRLRRSQRARLLRFPRSRQALGEAELALLGLTDANPRAWQQVADVYLWGSYRERPAEAADTNEAVPFNQVQVELRLNMWDGRSEVKTVERTVAVGDLESAIDRLADRLAGAAASGSDGSPSPQARRAAAVKLVERAATVRVRWLSGPNTHEREAGDGADRRAAAAQRYRLRLLELASFFAPRSPRIRMRMLETRYEPSGMGTGPRSKWRAVEDYARFLELFGDIASVKTRVLVFRKYRLALTSALRATNSPARRGLLRDMSDEEVRQLRRQLVKNLHTALDRIQQWHADAEPAEARRYSYLFGYILRDCLKEMTSDRSGLDLVRAAWPPYKPAYVRSKRDGRSYESLETRLYQLFFRVGRTDRLFQMLEYDERSRTTEDEPAAARRQRPEEAPVSEEWVRRVERRVREAGQRAASPPKANETSAVPRQQTAAEGTGTRSPSFSLDDVPRLDLPRRTLAFDRDMNARSRRRYRAKFRDRLTALTAADQAVWFVVRHERRERRRSVEHRLYAHRPAGDTLTDLTAGIRSDVPINDMLATDRAVWAATAGDGIWRIDPKTLALEHFTGEDGVLSPRIRRILPTAGRVLFVGHATKLNYFEPSTATWGDLPIELHGGGDDIASAGRWLIGPRDRRIDLESGQRTPMRRLFVERWGAAEDGTTSRARPDRERMRPTLRWSIIAADSHGGVFWMATRSHLIRYEPVAKAQGDRLSRWPLPGIRPHLLRAGGRSVWIAGTSRKRPSQDGEASRSVLLRLDVQADQWAGAFQITGEVTHLALGPRQLWIGRSGVAEPILEVHRAAPAAADIAGAPDRTGASAIGSPEAAPETGGTTPLMRAAFWGNAELVRRLLQRGAEVNARTDRGWTALSAAVRGGDRATVHTLLEHGAAAEPETDDRSERMTLPLIVAAEMGRAELIDLLVDHGARPGSPDGRGRTALLMAAEAGHLKAVRQLLDHGAEASTQEPGGWTALMHAAANAGPRVVRTLIEAGAGTDIAEPRLLRARRGEERTALLIAMDRRRPAIVRALLETGANPNAADGDGRTALAIAVKRRDRTLARQLLEAGAAPNRAPEGPTPLMLAAATGDTELVDLLLESGADLTASSTTRRASNALGRVAVHSTALSHAAGEGRLDMMERLVEIGLAPESPVGPTTVGTGALIHAARENQVGAIAKLLEWGVDVNARDANGLTPLMWSAWSAHAPASYLLLESGADPALRDRRGQTAKELTSNTNHKRLISHYERQPGPDAMKRVPTNPALRPLALIRAAERNEPDRAIALLQAGADANAERADGWPALTIAAARGHGRIVRQLLEHGADLARTGPGGWTALMQAAGRGHRDIVELLLEQGAQVLRMNGWGATALDLAERRGHPSVLERLRRTEAARNDGRILINAVQVRASRTVRLLLENGASVGGVDRHGRTALFHVFINRGPGWQAGRQQRRAMVETLLEHGAQVNRRDHAGQTPLMVALEHRVPVDGIRLLLEAGADVEMEDRAGFSPLQLARVHYRTTERDQIVSLLERAAAEAAP